MTPTNQTPSCSGTALPVAEDLCRIRPAVPADAPALAALARVAYQRYLTRMDTKPAPMTEDYARRIREGQVFVLEVCSSVSGEEETEITQVAGGGDHSVVAGFIVLIPKKDALLLDNVAVDPAAQGHGYGKRLIAFAEKYARARGFAQICLYTNEAMTENLQLYPHLGYLETHRAREKGFSRVFFSKSL